MIERWSFICIVLFFNLYSLKAGEIRLKDLARIKGRRENALIGGIGLVVGLPGTGDSNQSLVTQHTFKRLLDKFGYQIENPVNSRNLAIVSVTGYLPEFARMGDQFDVTLSSIGDSTSLKGGHLLFTELKGPDHLVYATVQGPIHAPGSEDDKNVNHRNVITLQATVEREFPTSLVQDGRIRLSLKQSDFSLAKKVVLKVNEHLKGFYAKAIDPRTIDITLPPTYGSEPEFSIVDFVADLEQIKIPQEEASIVVISRKSKTLSFGGQAQITPVVISHGQFDVIVKQNKEGKPVVLEDLAKGLQSLGASSEDLIAVIRALQASGALHTQIKIID